MKQQNSKWKRHFQVLLPLSVFTLTSLTTYCFHYHSPATESILAIQDKSSPDSLCPIPDIVTPANPAFSQSTVDRILKDTYFKNASAEKLAGAIRYPTEVYDEWGWIDENPDAWENYKELHAYFERTFPKVHKSLKLEKVYAGLLYTWEGKNPDLKPLVLMAHQDVVPVQKETIKDWTYPPYEGVFDGDFVWGRGAGDCKNLLVGIFETVEILLEEGFQPERTIVLSFGADEEAIGRSAYLLSRAIHKTYGDEGVYAILDEGGSGFELVEDKYYVGINTGEKGYLDAMIELFTPGGHSSVPPAHTSIGIIAELVKEIEKTPYEPLLTNVNPILGYLQCFAEHSTTIDKKLKSNILKSHIDEDANSAVIEWMEHESGSLKFAIRTSQAIDIIQGGAKSNALPEHVSILVNNRIGVESSVEFTSNKLRDNILQVADKYELGLYIENEQIREETANGYFNFTYRDPLPTAPVTPINDDTWNLLVGTLRNLYEKEFYPELFPKEDDYLVVTPSISTGNTDTKSYWDLTDHIFRFSPSSKEVYNSHAHSVDEKVDIDTHLLTIAFLYEYLLNLDHEIKK